MGTAIITGAGRLSYPHLLKSKANDRGEQIYSTAFLFPPDTDFGPYRAALKEAAVTRWGSDMAKWPKNLRGPDAVIRKCEDSDSYGAEFAGWHFINVSSKEAPGIIDRDKKEIGPETGTREVYPGRWARISINAFAYEAAGNKGVSFGLNNVQLLKHDQPLGGRKRANDEFDAWAGDDEDETRTKEAQDAGW